MRSIIGVTVAAMLLVPSPADADQRRRKAKRYRPVVAQPFKSSGPSYFRSCADARAAGAAPVRRGDAGYSRKLDRDGDGIGCE